MTLIEFTDYQCPYCRRHFEQTLPRSVADYVDTGKVRYVVREFPLTKIHSRAAKAAEAALCAAEQNKYWEMHDRLFHDQRKLSLPDLAAHAEALELDLASFQSCLQEGKYSETIQAGLDEAAKAGVSGTPSFLLGLTDRDHPGQVTATEYLRGAMPYARFQQVIDKLLAGDKVQPGETEE